jgi:hypothetical protein
MGALVAQKRAVDEGAETKPDAKKPEAPDAFAGAREQFGNILGTSPEEMQAQQQFQLGGLGRTMRTRQLVSTLRSMFAPMGGA